MQSEIPENCNMSDAKQSGMFSPRNLDSMQEKNTWVEKDLYSSSVTGSGKIRFHPKNFVLNWTSQSWHSCCIRSLDDKM